MNRNHLHKTIIAALFAALTCISTMIIQIPTPLQGYINLGDSIVLLSGWFLGPFYGACAAAVGSALADILTGYLYYAPATFLIKGLMALAAYFMMRLFLKYFRSKKLPALITSSIFAEAIMVIGYFGYSYLFMDNSLTAASGIPGNLIQAAAGILLGNLLYFLLIRIKPIREFLH